MLSKVNKKINKVNIYYTNMDPALRDGFKQKYTNITATLDDYQKMRENNATTAMLKKQLKKVNLLIDELLSGKE